MSKIREEITGRNLTEEEKKEFAREFEELENKTIIDRDMLDRSTEEHIKSARQNKDDAGLRTICDSYEKKLEEIQRRHVEQRCKCQVNFVIFF